MKIWILNLLYLIDVSIEVLLLKTLSLYFDINNFIYNCFIFSLFLPFFLYKVIKKYKNPEWYDLITGISDFLILELISVGVNNLTIGEYVSYRTSTTFFTVLLLYLIDRKILPILKYVGVGIIFIGCLLLIYFSGITTYVGTITCLFASLLYAISNIIIEKFVKTDDEKIMNYYWTKTISSVINLIIGITSEINYKTISNIYRNTNYLAYVIIISLIISITENFYYYLKTKIIGYYENRESGSMIINILDIIRRIIMLIVSIFIFKEIYISYIFLSFSLMIVGILFYIININYLKNKIRGICYYQQQIEDHEINPV
jgi:drug/metabolite transporter (DMT)-like permease